MKIISGKSITSEIAIGKIRFYQSKAPIIKQYYVSDITEELARYQSAFELTQKQLHSLYEITLHKLGKEDADIFDMHLMLLSDRQYHQAIQTLIREEHFNAEYAVNKVAQTLFEKFLHMEDAYVQARAYDIQDIANRLLSILSGETNISVDETEPFILMAENLSPSETIQLDSTKLLGFLTHQGSQYSHTAILAKTMHIPALMQIEIDASWDGHTAIIDGEKQCLYLDPDEALMQEYKIKKETMEQNKKLLQNLKGKPTVTKDGYEIQLLANINHISDVPMALEHDAQGIGLFRSEFIYLNTPSSPTEEHQFQIYRNVITQMQGKKVVIRTLDIGADKKTSYLMLEPEENPALGYRAIRICLTRPELFKTQLRALLRASAYGPVSIMFPMITSLWEVQKSKELLEECRQELSAESIPFGETELGIMIETPAAVMIAEDLAKEVSFFSIGTNDLTQYTLALDRNNASLDTFYDAHHPAILRMIQMVIDAAHRHNCKVCICGELGSDESLTKDFLKMGIDSLSVAPPHILPLRKIIRDSRL